MTDEKFLGFGVRGLKMRGKLPGKLRAGKSETPARPVIFQEKWQKPET
jgi:hypothetical protein